MSKPISSSLRSFLTIDKGDKEKDQIQEQERKTGDLISRLNAFLPEIERANNSLGTESTIVDIEQQTQPNAEEKVLQEVSTKRHGDHQQPAKVPKPRQSSPQKQTGNGSGGDGLIEMNLFVDNSLGQLVPCQQAAQKQGEDEANSLIREIDTPSSTKPSNSENGNAINEKE